MVQISHSKKLTVVFRRHCSVSRSFLMSVVITKEKYAIFYGFAFEQDTINKKTQVSLALTTGETECVME